MLLSIVASNHRDSNDQEMIETTRWTCLSLSGRVQRELSRKTQALL